MRLREEYEAKVASDELTTTGRTSDRSPGFALRGPSGGFDVTVEGVAISGPLENAGEIRAAMEHDWRSADIAGKANMSGDIQAVVQKPSQ